MMCTDRQRWDKSVRVCMCACAYVYVCACVCVQERENASVTEVGRRWEGYNLSECKKHEEDISHNNMMMKETTTDRQKDRQTERNYVCPTFRTKEFYES